ncbi:MAG TPA: flagellar export protein FliJ [Baekduia sp.]|uniref:flagellar export protein FliJ n=1 Tax=Baekduia sp. TaxID=2600305 RepID=UPI002D09C850|nr:flagellar export protein FliJ [Baekduia sp.]HMJ37899.1 flagellar export protein FliJ [Baekduia sp.]
MSAPFRFGLQRVREIRAHDEDQAKEAFAASLNERVRGEATLRAAESRLTEAKQEGVVSALGPLTGATLMSRQAWVERLERSRDDAAVRMSGYDADLARSRESLTDASRAREVLDKLEERQRAEHRTAAARVESAELDEMGLRAFSRQRAA